MMELSYIIAMHGDLIASTNLLKNLKNGLVGVARKPLPSEHMAVL